MKSPDRLVLAAALATGLLPVAVAEAAITTYSNQAAFITATPGAFDPTGMSTITTTAAARAAIHAADAQYGAADGVWESGPTDNVDFSFEHVRFSARPTIAGSIHTFHNSTSLIAGVEYNIYNSINENHSVHFAGNGALAFGFKAMDSTSSGVCVVTCGNSRFRVTLFAGADTLGEFVFDPPFSNSSTGYFGVVSDTPFTRMTVAESTAHSEPYDNEVFGEYRLLMAPLDEPPPEEAPPTDVDLPTVAAPAPESAGLLLGLGALLALRRGRGARR